MKPPLSAYIRTKNESRMIASVVRAAFLVADEVVIVDSGSSDDTVALAEAEGARIVRHCWLGSGRQKRLGEDACRHEWLLDLDADEVVTPALAAEIAALFKEGEPKFRIYQTPMAIAPPFGPPWIGFGGVFRRKLYDRRAARAPDHVAWDQFAAPEGIPVGRMKSPILHFAFADAGHLVDKVNRNSAARARALPPKSAPVLVLRILFGLPFYFAKRYIVHGLIRAGVQGFAFSMISAFGRWLRDVKMYERRLAERRG